MLNLLISRPLRCVSVGDSSPTETRSQFGRAHEPPKSCEARSVLAGTAAAPSSRSRRSETRNVQAFITKGTVTQPLGRERRVGSESGIPPPKIGGFMPPLAASPVYEHQHTNVASPTCVLWRPVRALVLASGKSSLAPLALPKTRRAGARPTNQHRPRGFPRGR